jgi:hypothetical protein
LPDLTKACRRELKRPASPLAALRSASGKQALRRWTLREQPRTGSRCGRSPIQMASTNPLISSGRKQDCSGGR